MDPLHWHLLFWFGMAIHVATMGGLARIAAKLHPGGWKWSKPYLIMLFFVAVVGYKSVSIYFREPVPEDLWEGFDRGIIPAIGRLGFFWAVHILFKNVRVFTGDREALRGLQRLSAARKKVHDGLDEF